MKHRNLFILLAVLLSLCLASCGSTTKTSGGSKSDKSPDGNWVYDDGNDYKESLSVDGESVLLEVWTGQAYKGTVNTKDSTMTFGDFGTEQGASIFDYEVINDKIVLTFDPEKNNGAEFRTMAFERVKEE